MAEQNLKPCPFCGCEVQAYKWGATYEVEIRCNNDDCGCACASGIVVKNFLETAKHAYKRAYDIAKAKWNRRTNNSAEVRRGKWIYNTDDFTPAERCSACGYNKPMIAGERTKQEPSNYCPNCGAKMD